MPDANGVALRSEACPFCGRKMEIKPMNRKGSSAPGVFLQCWQSDHRVQTLVFLRNGKEPEAPDADELESLRKEFEEVKSSRR